MKVIFAKDETGGIIVEKNLDIVPLIGEVVNILLPDEGSQIERYEVTRRVFFIFPSGDDVIVFLK